MKHLIVVALMLVIMRERWERTEPQIKCADIGETRQCWISPVYNNEYRRVYVIGEITHCVIPGVICTMEYRDMTAIEKFTIPIPNMPTKIMTPAEAEKANKDARSK